jgi:hypothetical protein
MRPLKGTMHLCRALDHLPIGWISFDYNTFFKLSLLKVITQSYMKSIVTEWCLFPLFCCSTGCIYHHNHNLVIGPLIMNFYDIFLFKIKILIKYTHLSKWHPASTFCDGMTVKSKDFFKEGFSKHVCKSLGNHVNVGLKELMKT